MTDSTTAYRMGKVNKMIQSLPDNPAKHLFWIVYNDDMIKYTEDRIKEIKGSAYMKHISVVSKSSNSRERSTGVVYFDPGLFYLLGNGNV